MVTWHGPSTQLSVHGSDNPLTPFLQDQLKSNKERDVNLASTIYFFFVKNEHCNFLKHKNKINLK